MSMYMHFIYFLQAQEPHKGLNVLTTCVFVVGVIAGSGFLTLPKAIDNSGNTVII